MYYIPQAGIVGYGRTQVLQHKCLHCGDLFFPGKPEKAFCTYCDSPKIRRFYDKESVFRVEVIGFIQKSVISNRRKTKNYAKVYKRDNYACRYCEYSPRYVLEFIPFHVDHVNPFSHGGSNSTSNMVLSCEWCNLRLSNKIFKDFFDKKTYIVEMRKKLNLPFTEKKWRKKSGILVGELYVVPQSAS